VLQIRVFVKPAPCPFVVCPSGVLANTLAEAEYFPRTVGTRITKAVAPLFISDPFKRKVQGLFATNPSIKKRISVLERM